VHRKSLDFCLIPHPATTDNVESGKNFELWMELNFLRPWNFCRRRSIDTDTPGAGAVCTEMPV
jgi:hypothetical protein